MSSQNIKIENYPPLISSVRKRGKHSLPVIITLRQPQASAITFLSLQLFKHTIWLLYLWSLLSLLYNSNRQTQCSWLAILGVKQVLTDHSSVKLPLICYGEQAFLMSLSGQTQEGRRKKSQHFSLCDLPGLVGQSAWSDTSCSATFSQLHDHR